MADTLDTDVMNVTPEPTNGANTPPIAPAVETATNAPAAQAVPPAAPAAPAPAPSTQSTRSTHDQWYDSEVERAKRYINERWQGQKDYYSRKSGEKKSRYQMLQLAIALGGAATPVLISLPGVAQEIPILVSLVVALAAATENVYRYGDDWKSFRQVVEGLKRERALFDAGAGPYRAAKEPYMRFVERCEDIIAEETGRYFEREERSQDGGSTANGQTTPSQPAYVAPVQPGYSAPVTTDTTLQPVDTNSYSGGAG